MNSEMSNLAVKAADLYSLTQSFSQDAFVPHANQPNLSPLESAIPSETTFANFSHPYTIANQIQSNSTANTRGAQKVEDIAAAEIEINDILNAMTQSIFRTVKMFSQVQTLMKENGACKTLS